MSIVAVLSASLLAAFGPWPASGERSPAVAPVAAPTTAVSVAVTTVAGIVRLPSIAVAPPSIVVVETPTTVADLSPDEVNTRRRLAAVDTEWQQGLTPFSLGGLVPDAPLPTLEEPEHEDCVREAKRHPVMVNGVWDRNLIAQMTHQVFRCLTAVAGLDEESPTALRRWNGAAVWGFGSLAHQVAAEAVVVAYCETEGFAVRALIGSNGFGYAGLFQMGAREMARFGQQGASRFDPVDNAIAAADYFLFQYRNRAGWGGWSPWAVVNTNFDDEINDQVRVPVLPRFVSTDPEFRGRRGAELPEWAVDPWSWAVPHWRGTGCPFTGGGWPPAEPLTDG